MNQRPCQTLLVNVDNVMKHCHSLDIIFMMYFILILIIFSNNLRDELWHKIINEITNSDINFNVYPHGLS
jgi:hypothetical protein